MSDEINNDINLNKIIRTFIKYKWLILLGSFTCAFIVGLGSFLDPRQYQSEALILVSPSILKPNNQGESGAQVSEVVVSSLEATTYEVLAKSEALMLTLADTLRNRLDPKLLKKISTPTDTYTIATTLRLNLEIELLDSGLRNVRSNTPLLVLRYSSSEQSLPPIVVNTWAEIFLQRNQGLSSNVTDGFYQNVVQQYNLAKQNLEQKEKELNQSKVASGELNRLKTEMYFSDANLDSSLKSYKKLKNDFEQKEIEYNYVRSVLKEIEQDGVWIGYLDDLSSGGRTIVNTSSSRNELVALVNKIQKLSQDSALVEAKWENKVIEFESQSRLKILDFERETSKSFKERESIVADSLIGIYESHIVDAKKTTNDLRLQILTLEQALSEQEPVLITRKAITDDALWENVGINEQIEIKKQKSLSQYKLITEQTNPIYLELKKSLSEVRKELDLITKTSGFKEAAIGSLRNISVDLHKDLIVIRKDETKLKSALVGERTFIENERQRERYDLLLQLSLKRGRFEDYKKQYEILKGKLGALKRQLDELITSIKYYENSYARWRERSATLTTVVDSLELEQRRIQRDVSVYTESFNRFAKLQEEARIARQQAAGDIQIVSKGEIAQRQNKGTLRKIVISGLIALFLLAFLAFLYEEIKRNEIL